MSEKVRNVTRRDFLKGMAVAGAMTATAGTLVSCQKEMPTGPVPKKWDEEADVVVVGSVRCV